MATNPYDLWGAERVDEGACVSGERGGERRYCGLSSAAVLVEFAKSKLFFYHYTRSYASRVI
jgi:hypothetical protein